MIVISGGIIGKITSAAFGYRICKPVTIALVKTRIASPLDGLDVDVDIAQSQNAGAILINPAFNSTGDRMRKPGKQNQ